MHWTGEKRLPAEEFDKIFRCVATEFRTPHSRRLQASMARASSLLVLMSVASVMIRSNYRLGSVLQKIRILQAECQKAGACGSPATAATWPFLLSRITRPTPCYTGIPVPLDHMLRGDKELKIPGLEPPSKTAASGKGKAKGAAAAPTPVDDSDVKRVRPKRTSSADRRAGGVGSNGGGEKSVVDEVEAPIVPGWVSAILLPVVSAVVGLVIAKYLMPYVLPPAGAP